MPNGAPARRRARRAPLPVGRGGRARLRRSSRARCGTTCACSRAPPLLPLALAAARATAAGGAHRRPRHPRQLVPLAARAGAPPPPGELRPRARRPRSRCRPTNHCREPPGAALRGGCRAGGWLAAIRREERAEAASAAGAAGAQDLLARPHRRQPEEVIASSRGRAAARRRRKRARARGGGALRREDGGAHVLAAHAFQSRPGSRATRCSRTSSSTCTRRALQRAPRLDPRRARSRGSRSPTTPADDDDDEPRRARQRAPRGARRRFNVADARRGAAITHGAHALPPLRAALAAAGCSRCATRTASRTTASSPSLCSRWTR